MRQGKVLGSYCVLVQKVLCPMINTRESDVGGAALPLSLGLYTARSLSTLFREVDKSTSHQGRIKPPSSLVRLGRLRGYKFVLNTSEIIHETFKGTLGRNVGR